MLDSIPPPPVAVRLGRGIRIVVTLPPAPPRPAPSDVERRVEGYRETLVSLKTVLPPAVAATPAVAAQAQTVAFAQKCVEDELALVEFQTTLVPGRRDVRVLVAPVPASGALCVHSGRMKCVGPCLRPHACGRRVECTPYHSPLPPPWPWLRLHRCRTLD